ncbi:hypothetical protein Thu_215 [Bacillus phage Thurquoise]|nr:hypothetical protein Thu_215 [Bacillus phage Thurquoise]
MNTDWIKCDEKGTIQDGGVTLVKKAPNGDPTFLVTEINEREWAGGTGYEIVVGEVDLESDLVPWNIVPVFYPSIKQPYKEVTDPKHIAKLWMLFRSAFFGMRIGTGTEENLRYKLDDMLLIDLDKLGIRIE